jgi:VIT1/CCC1 family predicted Fe2+/Mn2+ transporter
MADESSKELKDISLMEPGEYHILDPRWPGQQTLYIIRDPHTKMWVFKSAVPFKSQLKEFITYGVVVVLACVMIYFGRQSDLFSPSIYIGLIVLLILGGIVTYFSHRNVTLIQCNSWKLMLNKESAFRRLKHEWKFEEIQGFQIEENPNPPATRVGAVYNLKVFIRNRQVVDLITNRAYEELIWISEGLNRILGFEESTLFRDAWKTQQEEMTSESPDEQEEEIFDSTALEEKLANLDKPTGLGTKIEEVENGLSVTLKHANAGMWKIPTGISLILMLTAVIIPIFLIVYTEMSNAYLITLVIVPVIVTASLLWVGSSTLRKDSVVLLTDGNLVWIWSGRSRFCLIHLEDLEQVSIRKGNQYAFYLGIGIPKRGWFSFSKNYVLDLSLKNKTITSLNLPFNAPECRWIEYLFKEVFLKHETWQ